MAGTQSADQELAQIIESARRLGVEIDEEEALQWLAAIAATGKSGEDISVDEEAGVFGHRVALLDFDPADLDRLRKVAAIVEIEDRPNVETAIALSGSSAQSHVQAFPGDFDYFERVNIAADSQEEACRVLGDVIRDKALKAMRGQGFQLTEVHFGTYLESVVRGDKNVDAGSPISWLPAEVEDGKFEVLKPDGDSLTITWDYACQDPGWCKLDWVLVDPAKPRAIKASNMLDATWEAPDGSITPLDGFLDPYYQEVYLDAASIPIFSKIIKQMDPQALREYIANLENEVRKYTRPSHANYGKAAKRMYNVFRLTGRYEEAAYVRELFDEPAALLYQVSALLDGLIDLGAETDSIDPDTLVSGIDALMQDVMETTEGPYESELVMSLLRLRDHVTGRKTLGGEWRSLLLDMQGDIDGLVNQYFEERLRSIPQLGEYLDSLG